MLKFTIWILKAKMQNQKSSKKFKKVQKSSLKKSGRCGSPKSVKPTN